MDFSLFFWGVQWGIHGGFFSDVLGFLGGSFGFIGFSLDVHRDFIGISLRLFKWHPAFALVESFYQVGKTIPNKFPR